MVNAILLLGWLYVGVRNLFFEERINKLSYFVVWVVVVAHFVAQVMG